MQKYTKSNPLRIGTDCSGIEAPIQALQQLNIPHKHIWSSDTDKYCIQSIKARKQLGNTMSVNVLKCILENF